MVDKLGAVFSCMRRVNFQIFWTFIFPYAGLHIMCKCSSSRILSRPQKTILWIMVYYNTIFYLKILENSGIFSLNESVKLDDSVFLEGLTLCYQYQIYRNCLLNFQPVCINRAYVLQHFSQGYWILVRDKSGISQGFLCWNLCGHPAPYLT